MSQTPHVPRRRAFSPAPGSVGDVDQAQRVRTITILLWAGIPGLFLGALLGYFLGYEAHGARRLLLFFAGLLGVPGGMLFLAFVLTGGSGAAATVLHAPSGRSTSRRREHSLAEAMVARGDVLDGIAAFEHAILEDPTDSIPYSPSAGRAPRKATRPATS